MWTNIPSGVKTVDKLGSVLSLKYVGHTGIEDLGWTDKHEHRKK